MERATARLVRFNKDRKGKSAVGRHPQRFDSWTEDLVTLVSHFLFDGEIRYSGCVYTNRSAALLKQVSTAMRLIYAYPPNRVESSPGVRRISYHNVELAALMNTKADELIKVIPKMPVEHKRALLQAFFGDEGSVYFIGKKRHVRGYQHSIELLKLIQRLLGEFWIQSRIDTKYFELVVSRRGNLERFAREINFTPGVRINGNRSNSIWKRSLEKREILRRAIASCRN